ncbi:MAG: hypothetical protein QM632_02650 [Micrococcaceae bacterium]
MDKNVQKVYESFVELYSSSGLSTSAAKIISWLTVCDPSEQTVEDIRKATGVSAGVLSESLRMFVKVELVNLYKKPGSRKHYYEMTEDNFLKTTSKSFQSTKKYRAAAIAGLEKLPNNKRLSSMHNFYDFLSPRLDSLIEEYKKELSQNTES